MKGKPKRFDASCGRSSCLPWPTSTIGSMVAAAETPISRGVGRLASGRLRAARGAGRGPAQDGSAYDEASGKGAAHVDQQGAGARGNFAGLTAALSLKHELQDGVDITVVAKSDRFQFNPSFIWIPFGKRKVKDVVFPVAKTFTSHGVKFVHGEATKIDPAAQQVQTTQGDTRVRLPGDRHRLPQ